MRPGRLLKIVNQSAPPGVSTAMAFNACDRTAS
jgi:hypothetical protein